MYANAPLFVLTVDFLIEVLEGSTADHAQDKGGLTRFGISSATFPGIDVESLSREEAMALYYNHYWAQYRCDELPPALAVFLFDSVVNHRPKPAVKILQQALRCNLVIDGILGSKTIAASHRVTAQSVLIDALALRADFYHDIVQDDPSQEVFLLGWFARLFRLQKFIQGLSDGSLADD